MKLFILFSITTAERNANDVFLCVSYSITLDVNTHHAEVWSCLYSWPNFTEFQCSGSTGFSCGNCLIWGYIGKLPLNFGCSVFVLYKCSAILQGFPLFSFHFLLEFTQPSYNGTISLKLSSSTWRSLLTCICLGVLMYKVRLLESPSKIAKYHCSIFNNLNLNQLVCFGRP